MWQERLADRKVLAIVPIETETSLSVAQRFAKLPKTKQHEILNEVCDSMLKAKAWDQIAGLLAVHLENDANLVVKILGRK
jgi:hypothetical protein